MLVLHAELTDTPGKSWILPTVYILLTQKDTPIYLEAFEALTSNCPALLPQVVMADFEQALRSALYTSFPGAEIDGCHFCQAILRNVNQPSITILIILLFRLHFCRNQRLIRNFRIYWKFLFLYI